MIGERLREARQSAQLTLRDLSSKVDISAATLSRIETNQQALDLSLFLQLAKVLKIRPQDLLEADDGESGIDPMVRCVAALRPAERITFWRELANRTRKNPISNRMRIRGVAMEVEELLAQVDVVRAEIEAVQRRLRAGRRK